MRSSVLIRVLLLCLVLLLSGCINLGEGTRATNFYLLPSLLDRQSPQDVSQEIPPSVILVGPISLPGHLDRNQIVTHTLQGRVDLAEFERWAEPLGDQLTRVIKENLAVLMPERRVVDFRQADGILPGRQISVEIRRFEGILGEKLLVDLNWWVKDSGTGQILEMHQFRSDAVLTGRGYLDLVGNLGKSLQQLSREIATRLQTGANPS